jgi:hypothetical protein
LVPFVGALSHGLRRGLHSWASSRLIECPRLGGATELCLGEDVRLLLIARRDPDERLVTVPTGSASRG